LSKVGTVTDIGMGIAIGSVRSGKRTAARIRKICIADGIVPARMTDTVVAETTQCCAGQPDLGAYASIRWLPISSSPISLAQRFQTVTPVDLSGMSFG
jgi:hypothetical protein